MKTDFLRKSVERDKALYLTHGFNKCRQRLELTVFQEMFSETKKDDEYLTK